MGKTWAKVKLNPPAFYTAILTPKITPPQLILYLRDQKMDIESNSKPKSAQSLGNFQATNSKKTRNKNRSICLAVIAVLLLTILILVILAFTVFKAKKPEITINSVSLSDFHVSVDIARLGVNLNLTLAVAISVKNRNRVGFKYKNSSALLRYHGKVVGEVPVPAGEISAGETKPMNLSLELIGNRFLSDSSFVSDVIKGSLPLSTFTRISGKVRILLFNVHVVSSTSCDFDVNVVGGSIENQTCKYKTKL